MPRLLSSLQAVLATGPSASSIAQQEAAASLYFFVRTAPAFLRSADITSGLPAQLPPVSWLVRLLPLCAQFERVADHPISLPGEGTMVELILRLLAIEATALPHQVLASVQGCVVFDSSLWLTHSRASVVPITDATLEMVEGIVHGIATSGGDDGAMPPLPPSLLPIVLHVVDWALPLAASELRAAYDTQSAENAGQGEWGLTTRVFCLLNKLLDHEGAAAASHASHMAGEADGSLLQSVLPRLVESETSSNAILVAVERATLALGSHVEGRKTRPIAIQRQEASICANLSASLGLMLRLLHSTLARAPGCLLYSVLLSSLSPPSSGVKPCMAVRQLGLCMLLHDEVVRQVPADAASSLADLGAELYSVGPLAARCLALLCHATPPPASASPLVIGLAPLSPSLSSLLSRWIKAALSPHAHAEQAGGDADCAYAALQLLGESRAFTNLSSAPSHRDGPYTRTTCTSSHHVGC